MIRILLFSVSGFAIFVGCAVPFILPGATGVFLAVSLILAGALALWVVDWQTRSRLDKDTSLNRLMKADGEDLLPRMASEDDSEGHSGR